jgi:hypothetical protein
MALMGVNMLGIFPALRKLTPRLPHFTTSRKSPLIVGLLNGLMPCGPLQAMQIYALSTGSPLKGALSMLFFSLGTAPLMFGLGALSSVLGKKFSAKVMTAGAVLVCVLGLSMLTQGWNLAGLNSPSVSSAAQTEVTITDGVQIVKSTLESGRYPNITVQIGMPVKWVIDAPRGSVNGCNYRMSIGSSSVDLQTGENVIEFVPDRTGKFGYTCWMGMIRGTITVTDGG